MKMETFLNSLHNRGLSIYGIRVMQDGKIVGSAQIADDIPYSLFSAAKSFMATAAGIAIDEGLLSLQDRPAAMFADHLPDNPAGGYERITLEHLLIMASGHDRALLMEKERAQLKTKDWIRYFFEQPLVYEPGTRFAYSNASSYLAGCMVEEAVGATLQDYAYEKIFRPMDIPYCEWLKCPLGHTFAPTRLYMRIDDLIKLGVLYLGGGEYNGRRIVSGAWVETATQKHIESSQICPIGMGEDERCGYGYQFWMCRYPGVFRAYGRNGQFVIVIPDKKAIVATMADEPDVQAILDAVWEEVLPQL
ncbi:MAG: serine hydrolase domain-containing protein [Bacillota bacterium]